MAEQRLFHSIAEQIRKLIDEGVFPPGTRLPGERELAERFGVSRVTIREAGIALQAIGRIEIKTGSGAYVSEKQPKGKGKLPDVSAFELAEARSLIEGEAAALAAKVISDKELEKLDRLMVEMASEDQDVSLAADREFHATIARASGNGVLVHTIETLWRIREELPAVKHSFEAVCEEDTETRAQEHQDILDSLKARNSDAARSTMRQHFRRLIGSMLDASEQEALRELHQRTTETRERFLKTAQLN